MSSKQKYEDKKRADKDAVQYGRMTQAEFDKKWTRTERPKPVKEATGLKKRVKIVKGTYAGKTGYVGEVHHGLFKGAPKQFVIDLDGGGNIKCSKDELRLIKDTPIQD